MKLKQNFTSFGPNEDGVEADLQLAVRHPSAEEIREANLYRISRFHDAVRKGVPVEKQAAAVARQTGIWDEADTAEYDRLSQNIAAGVQQLEQGGDFAAARTTAFGLLRDRLAQQRLDEQFVRYLEMTAEGVARQAEFDFKVSCCTVYNEGRFAGKPYFSVRGEGGSVDRLAELKNYPVVEAAGTAFFELTQGSLRDGISTLPEFAFLLKYRQIDSDGNAIDRDGNRITEDGRRIDAEGYLINEAGERIDANGDPVPPVLPAPAEPTFTDSDGNPLPVPS